MLKKVGTSDKAPSRPYADVTNIFCLESGIHNNAPEYIRKWFETNREFKIVDIESDNVFDRITLAPAQCTDDSEQLVLVGDITTTAAMRFTELQARHALGEFPEVYRYNL